MRAITNNHDQHDNKRSRYGPRNNDNNYMCTCRSDNDDENEDDGDENDSEVS